MSATCFDAHWAILMEDSLSLLKTICYRKIVIMDELQSKKYFICGFFTGLFTIIRKIQYRCYGL